VATDGGGKWKILAPLRILGRIYTKTFRDDARKAGSQISRGFIMTFFALCFFFNCILVLNIICIFAFNILLQNWLYSGLLTLSVQVLLALIFLFSARNAFSGPYFQDTKKMLAEGLRELQ